MRSSTATKRQTTPPTVVIAGGTGFVGRHLAECLKDSYRITLLSRREPSGVREDGVRIERCDLFSLLDVERALKGADYAVYLVHSMLPTSRLTQASFADQDLLLADNFARGAVGARIKQIVYLGGLIPSGDALSQHLRSRREVELALGSRGTPLTAVRAGLVIGAGGSSYEILEHLVRRLPVMICPSWTRTPSQAVALEDVVLTIKEALANRGAFGQVWNVGAEPSMSYLEMMRATARVLGKRRIMATVPVDSWFLSRLWVRTFSGAPHSLVGPLVESMKHPMVAEPNHLEGRSISFDDAVRRAAKQKSEMETTEPPARPRKPGLKKAREVRSIQRMVLPPGRDAAWATMRYGLWIDAFSGPMISAEFDRRTGRLILRLLGICVLELLLSRDRSADERMLFYITGGLLAGRAQGRARLEFRSFQENNVLLTAIHDFCPSLPWFIYSVTQAPLHLWIMRLFARYLARYASRSRRAGAPTSGKDSGSPSTRILPGSGRAPQRP